MKWVAGSSMQTLRLFLFKKKQLVSSILKDDVSPNCVADVFHHCGSRPIYQQTDVSQWSSARYHRYVPHTVVLGVRAFSLGQHGTSPRQMLEVIKYKTVKHPPERDCQSCSSKNIGIENRFTTVF